VAYDLDVPYGKSVLKTVLEGLSHHGYRGIALNHVVSQITKAEANTFKAAATNARSIFEFDSKSEAIQTKDKNRTLYTRLTFKLDSKEDANQILTSHQAILPMYDIIAVAPTDFKSFQAACTLDVDIVVMPYAMHTSFLRRNMIKSAIDRGVHFELSLGPYLRTPEYRKNFFANGAAFIGASGGKNLLISNGAEDPEEVRGPYDLANLATLFGTDFGTAKGALTHAPVSILKRVEARRAAKAVLRVRDLGPVPSRSDPDPSHTDENPIHPDPNPNTPAKGGDKTPPTSKKRKGKRKAEEQ